MHAHTVTHACGWMWASACRIDVQVEIGGHIEVYALALEPSRSCELRVEQVSPECDPFGKTMFSKKNVQLKVFSAQ